MLHSELKIETSLFALWSYSSTPVRANSEKMLIIFLPLINTVVF